MFPTVWRGSSLGDYKLTIASQFADNGCHSYLLQKLVGNTLGREVRNVFTVGLSSVINIAGMCLVIIHL